MVPNIKEVDVSVRSWTVGAIPICYEEQGHEGALLAEQRLQNNIWHELESPTHHHTKEQIKSLKQFCASSPNAELWQAFMEWSKNGPKVYSVGSKIDKD